ncbi:putative HTH-type transcriptional regulator YqaF [Paenibacillus faecis]|uniref:helix-turn-helix transcriptional regulator n=1 Tax=Paenibacillus faecis TaxID=862114 RepID=UPI001B197CCA|nr:helix-turn-helix transcriptional regulator [Paenibacillus faecis]GIO84591.1 putative HTH-type transcriptional regulator YqaF [Paenibacillus faecis]
MERTLLISYRDIKGLTQEQVAELCDIKRPYYTMIELGKRRPSVDVAKRIAEVLGFEWTLFFAPDGSDSLHLDKKTASSERKEVG